MAGLTYDDLYQVSLSSLGSAAEDWKEMVDQLATLATDASDGMVRQSDAARWEGVNAGVTRPFVRTTAAEFRDAHAQAKSIWSMLRDAHQDLTAVQKALKKAVDVDAKKHSILVSGGPGSTVTCTYVDRSGEKTKLKPDQVEYLKALEEQINHLLVQANEIDDSVSRALGRIHGGDSHDFGHAKYDTLDDAQRERTVQLAKKSLDLHMDGKELSNTELAEFQRLMQSNSKDAEFAVEFYREMGPKEALRFQAQLAVDASTGDDSARLELAKSIQEDMGLALATATDPPTGKDNPHTSFREDRTYLGRAWVNELKKVGTKPLDLGVHHAEPLGYQALASLLRNGNYDKSFLKPIAEDMVVYERKNAGWPTPDSYHGDLDLALSLSDKKSPGWDPMTGLLEGLANSPDASTAFFNGSTGGGDSDLKKLSNLEFFTSEDDGRVWPSDKLSGTTHPDDDSTLPSKQALGHALESATSGRPYGDDGPSRPHTTGQADVFEKVVQEFGSNPDLIKHDGNLAVIAPNLGNMSAEYMYDIQRDFSGEGGAEVYFKHAGAVADLSNVQDNALKQFLRATAEDPKAYGAMANAQQAVTTEAIRVGVADPGAQSLSEVSQRATRPGGIVAGCMAEGRAEAIAAADDSVKKIDEYNKNVELGDKWIGRITDMAANHIPVAGDAASWITEDIREAVVKHYTKDGADAVAEIERNSENYLEEEAKETAEAAKRAFVNAARQEGVSTAPGAPGFAVAGDVYSAAYASFRDGNSRNA
ncbi:hypothetical protein OYE22_19795 [Streptomyces sp. 71268]|uniref:hypothetical protein n=1 Tax=Streptomyces sp. 71268 TaxID=3002640 RepID=UPI0023F76F53|nr:hypothetical protein [Streptomyces sp. 71268]WEV27190.1 hypothetical protein OYE22_19795 [Streptomyces sp. 71268]